MTYCDICGVYEPIDRIWIEDTTEPGMVRRVYVCHVCIKEFKAA